VVSPPTKDVPTTLWNREVSLPGIRASIECLFLSFTSEVAPQFLGVELGSAGIVEVEGMTSNSQDLKGARVRG